MSFQFASTNLVLELGVILWVLMGWQFTLAEFVGCPSNSLRSVASRCGACSAKPACSATG
jgi:hypothetical protein